jgi:hypothetical protein
MRCILCGEEMRLVQVDRDDTMMVPGYERHTLECSGCNEVERRTVFMAASPSRSDEPAPVEATQVGSMVSQADPDFDEGEEMLRRAIAMVRGPARGTNIGIATGLTGFPPPKKSLPGRVVRIRHEIDQEEAYVAADAQTGLVVLRHQDRERLRAMCQRLGWQVEDADAEVSGASN